jgi:tetratricopeptide (TPR) repeat protein
MAKTTIQNSVICKRICSQFDVDNIVAKAINCMEKEKYVQAILIVQGAINDIRESKVNKTYWSRDGKELVLNFIQSLEQSTNSFAAIPFQYYSFFTLGLDHFKNPLRLEQHVEQTANSRTEKGRNIWQVVRKKKMKLNQVSNSDATLYYCIGRCQFQKQEYEEAFKWYKKSIISIENWNLCQGPVILAALFGIGHIQFICGEFTKALETFNLALSFTEFNMGVASLEVAACLNCIGVVHNMFSPISECSLELLTTAKDIQVAILDEEHIHVSTTWNNIGRFYHHNGKYDEALASYKHAHRIRRKAGQGSMDYADTLLNIGLIYNLLGKSDIALVHFQKYLKTNKKKLKEDDCVVLNVVGLTGIILLESGDKRKGLKMYQQLLKVENITPGPAHEQILGVLGDYGKAYFDRGELHNALMAYYQVLRIATALLEPSNSIILIANQKIAAIYELMKEFKLALVHYHSVIAFMLDIEPDNIDIGFTMATVSYIEYTLGDNNSAIKSLLRCLQMIQSMPYLTRNQIILGILLDTYEKCVGNCPNGSIYITFCMFEIGLYKLTLGDLDQALQFLLQSVKYSQSIQNDVRSPLVAAQAYRAIGKLYSCKGELTVAAHCYRVALQIDQESYCFDHQTCAEIWNEIGNIELQLGNVEEVMQCYTKALRIYMMNNQSMDELNILGLALWRFEEISRPVAPVA